MLPRRMPYELFHDDLPVSLQQPFKQSSKSKAQNMLNKKQSKQLKVIKKKTNQRRRCKLHKPALISMFA
jgi:hypothetical protein